MHQREHTRELAIATLAAALIVTRSSVTIMDVRMAWRDAMYIAAPPDASDKDYKAWQRQNGETPTSDEDDMKSARRSQATQFGMG